MAKKRSTKKKSPRKKKSAVAKGSHRKRSGSGRAATPEPKVRLLEDIGSGGDPGSRDPFDQRFRIELGEAVGLEFFRERYGFADSAAESDKAWRQLDRD